MNLFDFTGKTALITGGSRGLGREIALGIATTLLGGPQRIIAIKGDVEEPKVALDRPIAGRHIQTRGGVGENARLVRASPRRPEGERNDTSG